MVEFRLTDVNALTGSSFQLYSFTIFFFFSLFSLCVPMMIDIYGAETAKLISEDFVAYKVFGEPGGPHYGHYDLVGGRMV